MSYNCILQTDSAIGLRSISLLRFGKVWLKIKPPHPLLGNFFARQKVDCARFWFGGNGERVTNVWRLACTINGAVVQEFQWLGERNWCFGG